MSIIPLLAFLEGYELVIVLVILLVLFGGAKLPQLARSVGSAQREFKKGLAEGDDPKDANKSESTNSESANTASKDAGSAGNASS